MRKYKIYMLVSFAIYFFMGCKEEKLPGNSIYLENTFLSGNNTVNLAVDKEGVMYELVAKSSETVNTDVNISYGISNDELIKFNEVKQTNYKLLPDDYYTLSSREAVINSGSSRSNKIVLNVKSIDNLPDTNQYAIPITIENISNEGIELIKSSKTLFVLFSKVIYTTAPRLGGSQNMTSTYKQPFKGLSNWTFEWRVNSLGLDANNQALISSGDIYSRFGDVVIKPTQLQVKTAGSQYSPGYEFEANRWYNIALTYDGSNLKWYQDGELIMNQPLPGKVYDFESISVGGGGGGQGTAKARIFNEVRFWSVARTQSQIVNNLYVVNPNSPGLQGYWKCNEGQGNKMKDYSVNANDLNVEGGFVWEKNVRMPALQSK